MFMMPTPPTMREIAATNIVVRLQILDRPCINDLALVDHGGVAPKPKAKTHIQLGNLPDHVISAYRKLIMSGLFNSCGTTAMRADGIVEDTRS